jgi:hypothetical protein
MDYATRIICDSAPGNIVSLPSSDGTLALTTDNVASATKATQDGSGNDIESTYATKAELSNATASTIQPFDLYDSNEKEHFGRKQILTLLPFRL